MNTLPCLNLTGAHWTDPTVEENTVVEPLELLVDSALFYNGDAYQSLCERVTKITELVKENKYKYAAIILTNNELGRALIDEMNENNIRCIVRDRFSSIHPYWMIVNRFNANLLA